MAKRWTRAEHGTDPAVPNTAGAWVGYVVIMAAVAMMAMALAAFAYGFEGLGVVAVISAVASFGLAALLLTRAGRVNVDRYLDRDRLA
jgi:energy-converting hydrogenase Eha subunit H